MNYVSDFGQNTQAGGHTRTATSALGFTLKLYETLNDAKSVWCAFEPHAIASGLATKFQSFDYCAAWMEHVGAAKNIQPLIVTGRDTNDEIIFIMPFCLRKSGPLRILEWIGGDDSNYQSGLYTDNLLGSLNPVSMKTLWCEIKALLPKFDSLFLRNQPERLGSHINPFAHLSCTYCADNYFQFALSPDFDALEKSKRSSKSRRAARKRDERLDELGAITFTRESDREIIASTMDAIFIEKNKQLARLGRAEKFPKAARDFFIALSAPAENKAPIYELFTLRLDGKMIAASISLISGTVISGIVLFMVKGEHDRLSPGDRLIRTLIKWSCENGLETFDMSHGRAAYKDAWADEERRLFETLVAYNPWAQVHSAVLGASCHLKRTIKSSDTITHFLLKNAKRLAPRRR